MSLVSNGNGAPLCLAPRMPRARLGRKLPAGTVDCHFHVFDANAPLAPTRDYTPQIATLDAWLLLAAQFGIERGILVQPSVYGFDNSVLLDALAHCPDKLRGVVVIDPDTPADELKRLHAVGVRGVRINTRNAGGLDFDDARTIAKNVKSLGWIVQFQIRANQLDEVANVVERTGVTAVLDHLAFLDFDGQDWLVQLNRLHVWLDMSASCVLKISAPYRLSRDRSFAVFCTAVSQLAVTHPQQLIWGTDWPHSGLWGHMPDDADLIERIRDPTRAAEEAVFRDNAVQVFWSD